MKKKVRLSLSRGKVLRAISKALLKYTKGKNSLTLIFSDIQIISYTVKLKKQSPGI